MNPLRPSRRAVAALLLLAACAAPPPLEPTPDGARERAVFDQVLRDLGRQQGAAGLNAEVLDEQTARFTQLMEWHDAGELQSSQQRFWAGAALVRSDEPAHLMVAEALGASAAVMGEPRGRIVEAEARDRMSLLLGEPQPYGTQMVYEPLVGQWRLYAVDPRTTDDDRRAMGLPDLADLRARAERRNDSALTRRLRDEMVRPTGLIR